MAPRESPTLSMDGEPGLSALGHGRDVTFVSRMPTLPSVDPAGAVPTFVSRLRDGRRRVALTLTVDQANWIHVRPWLVWADAMKLEIRIDLALSPDPLALAALDGDAIAVVRDQLVSWLRQFPGTRRRQIDRAVAVAMARWQASAAERPACRHRLGLPPTGHPLVESDAAFEHLLGGLLRLADDTRVRQWLRGLVEDEVFAREARSRRSRRVVALWLACELHSDEALAVLRSAFDDRSHAGTVLAADGVALEGSALHAWFVEWIARLGLDRPGGRTRRFAVGADSGPIRPGPPDVTVVIPSFNHERFVADAMRSVLTQTAGGMRVLVVDDGSTDRTVEVARGIADDRVRIIVNPVNRGLGRSLAAVIGSVETAFVACLNSDDLFDASRLDACLTRLRADPAVDVVATGVRPIDEDGLACTSADASPVFDGWQICDWIRWFEAGPDIRAAGDHLVGALFERNFLITTSNIVARTECLKASVGDWESLEFCVDWAIFLRAARDGRLAVLPDELLGYRLHGANTVWFDSGRRTRYYLEVNRVAARALAAMLAASVGTPARRLESALRLMVRHLPRNADLDWAAIWLSDVVDRMPEADRGLTAPGDAAYLGELARRRPPVEPARGPAGESELRYLRAVRNRHEAAEVVSFGAEARRFAEALDDSALGRLAARSPRLRRSVLACHRMWMGWRRSPR